MINILFICHGNICRSPMAEFVFKDMLQKQGLEDHFYVASAAVSAEEVGHPVHPGTRRKLEAAGISCRGKVARQIALSDYDEYQYIIPMDEQNLRDLKRRLGGDPARKLFKLLFFCGEPGDIADPWYTGDFSLTWQDVTRGCAGLLNFILEQKGVSAS